MDRWRFRSFWQIMSFTTRRQVFPHPSMSTVARQRHCLTAVQIHQPLSWSSADVAAKHPDIHLGDWDAAAEVALEEGYDFETMTNASTYFSEIILPDERRVFVDEARKHMKAVPAGAVKGSWVEFIVDGKAVVDFEKAREAWEGHEGKASWRGLRVM